MAHPLVSVVMPAFNSSRYIAEAISSVLAQTHKKLELIIINDGSTDDTANVVSSFRDERVKLFNLKKNFGLAAARNEGLAHANGEFVAWLDSDDIAHPKRLIRQLDFFARNPNVGICGTWVLPFGDQSSAVWRYPRNPIYIRSEMLFDDPVATSSVTMRRKVLKDLDDVFRPNFAPAEDYDLWERLARSWGVANIPKVLTRYRIHATQTSSLDSVKQHRAIKEIQVRQLTELGISPSPEEWRIHLALGIQWGTGLMGSDLEAVEDWVMRLKEANARERYFPVKSFEDVLGQHRRRVLNCVCPSLARKLSTKIYTARH
jgi:glycosyltransferase involved in cell wall biosynthesis